MLEGVGVGDPSSRDLLEDAHMTPLLLSARSRLDRALEAPGAPP